MNNKSSRREFERFSIDFVMGVYAKDAEGKRFNEKVVLKDISGGGAKFITQKSDIFFLGQLLEITVFLPKIGEVEAHMKTKATVVRIDQATDSEKENESRGRSIAVKFEIRLNFERI